MKRLTISVTSENEDALLAMMQKAIFQYSLYREEKSLFCSCTYTGLIIWSIEDSSSVNMVNYTLAE
jgi:hypothetical protein